MMRYVLTGEQTRAAEAAAVAEGVTLLELMEHAGAALALEAVAAAPEGRILILTGRGNNGGDGWVVARLLSEAGREVAVLSAADPSHLASPADEAFGAARRAGVPFSVATQVSDAVLAFAESVLVIDALLGIGVKGAPREPYADLIEALNDSDALVLSADVPSGVDANTGAAPGSAVFADATVTFSAPKVGLVLQPGAVHAGDLVMADVGVPARFLEPDGALESWDFEDYAEWMPEPGVLDHKYARGHLLVVGGAPGTTGAACLAATAALRAGAGYVTVAVPAPSLPVVECKLTAPVKLALPARSDGSLEPEALDALLEAARRADAVLIGPGLGRSDATSAIVRGFLERAALPVLVDADALFALGVDPDAVSKRAWPTVLTPHSGEAGRLLGTTAGIVEEDRVAAARDLVRGQAVVVLKGPATLVAGSGRLVVNPTGGPGLATLGTGDVLAGVVGALLAQGLPALEAAALGAFLHGAAGDFAADDLTPICCTAEDVVAYLPEAVRPLLQATD